MINNLLRNNCCVTGSQPLTPVYTFKNFPIGMSCVETDPSTDIFADMKWAVSNEGHLQLKELLDPDLIYKNYHNPGMIGKIWAEHHQRFSDFIRQDNFSDVIEIGGGSGVLAEKMTADTRDFSWTIIEPSIYKTFSDSRIQHISQYFETAAITKQFDTVVHSHCFEHCYNPMEFLQKIRKVLKPNGLHYISIPNMKYWLENQFTNTLSFEHTFYVDHDVLCYLLEKSGFRILESQVNNHSLFVKSCKNDFFIYEPKDFSYISDIFDQYVNKLHTDISHIIQTMGTQSVYLFGAHIFAQVLLNLGLPENQINSILDNDPQKIGKRLYGTNLGVQSPKILQNQSNPVVILRAGSYTTEIQESILAINPTTQFI